MKNSRAASSEVEAALSDPKRFDNPAKSQEMSREYARLKELIEAGGRYLKVEDDLAQHAALLKTEPADSEMAQMAREEIAALASRGTTAGASKCRSGLAPPDPADSRNTIIEIRAGAGGSESALFAADLYRMYTRYAEDRGWKVESMDSSPSDLGGFKEVIFGVTGDGRFQAAQIRERRPSRPARAGHRGAGAHPHQHGHRRRAARGARRWTSKSSRRNWRSTSAAPPARAARASIPPIPPCKSFTSRPA